MDVLSDDDPSTDHPPRASEPARGSVFSALRTLARAEYDLLIAELRASVRRIRLGFVLLALGIVLALSAVFLIPAFAILGLAALGFTPLAATALTFAALALAAAATLFFARRALSPWRIVPRETLASLRRDAAAIRAAWAARGAPDPSADRPGPSGDAPDGP